MALTFQSAPGARVSVYERKNLATGQTSQTQTESWATAWSRQVSRPDIIHRNKPDTYGFRKASPWGVSSSSVTNWAGRIRMRFETSNALVYGTVVHSGTLGTLFGQPPFDTSMPLTGSSEQYMAETMALVDVKQARANYAVAAAEAGKSMSMIEKNIVSITRAYRAARRFRWAQAARALGVSKPSWRSSSRDVSGRWLELQYGWLPLLMDIKGIHDDLRVGYEPRLSVKKTIVKDMPGYHEKKLQNSVHRFETVGRYGVTVRLDYSFMNPLLSIASQTGLSNPAVVAWELLPFSFIADWLVPLGDYFSALDAASGLTFKSGSCTHWARMKRTGYILLDKSIAKNGELMHCDVRGSAERFYMSRTVYQASPRPVPFLKPGLGGYRVLNAIALLRAAVR